MSGERLTDHMDAAEFEERLARAWESPRLTDHDREFLADVEANHAEWGDDLFFSAAQARYLRLLSVRGGYRPAPCDEDAA